MCVCVWYTFYSVKNKSRVDLSVMILQYYDDSARPSSVPYPSSCVANSNSRADSSVTCSALLNPGRYDNVTINSNNVIYSNLSRYVVVPMSFKCWNKIHVPPQGHTPATTASPIPRDHLPIVLALFSSKVIERKEGVRGSEGFMVEALFQLARKQGQSRQVRNCVFIIVGLLIDCHVIKSS